MMTKTTFQTLLSPRGVLAALLVGTALPALGALPAGTDLRVEDAAHAVDADGIPKNLGLGLGGLMLDHRTMLEHHYALEAAGLPRTDAQKTADLAAIGRKYSHAQFDRKGRILVNVYLDGTKPLARMQRRLRKHKFKLVAQVESYRSGVISAWMPLTEGVGTAHLRGVRAIQLAPRPYFKAGTVTSQGASVLKADITGYTGVGSKIGALSDTFNLLKTSQNAATLFPDTAEVDSAMDDLPSQAASGSTTGVDVVLDVTTGVPTDEGRGMLQIIHDVAPSAALAFATAEGTETVFANNIIALGTPADTPIPPLDIAAGVDRVNGAGCNIICDDVGYFDEPMFSDGIVAQAIDTVATTYGVSYFSSAGNDGNSGYSGDFTFVDPNIPTANTPDAGDSATTTIPKYQGVDLSYTRNRRGKVTSGVDPALYAGGFDAFATTSGSPATIVQNVRTGSLAVSLVFQWDDPYDNTLTGTGGLTPVTTDYNILVFDADGTFDSDRSGTADNYSTNQPIELPNTTLDANTSYKIVICRTGTLNTEADGTPIAQQATHLRYAAPSDGGGFSGDFIGLDSVETYGHNCASNCSGVAAYVYDAIPNINKDPTHVPTPLVESFSSNGPVMIYFDATGKRLPTGNLRRQPAFATVDGVDTSFFPATTGYVATPGSTPVTPPVIPITPPVAPPIEPIIGGPNPQDYDNDQFPNFFGTSAAAPHAAACAALIIEAANTAGLAKPNPRYIRSLLQATTQGEIDTLPGYVLATGTDAGSGYSVDLIGTGDVSTDPNTFLLSLHGPANGGYQLSSLVFDTSNSELVFDTNAVSGFGPAQGDPVGTSTATIVSGTVGAGTSGVARTALKLTFSGFNAGNGLHFGVDRDVEGINAFGNGVDQLQGSIFTATLTPTGRGAVADAVQPSITIVGVFDNETNREYNFKAGYGLVDVNAAINRMLGIKVPVTDNSKTGADGSR